MLKGEANDYREQYGSPLISNGEKIGGGSTATQFSSPAGVIPNGDLTTYPVQSMRSKERDPTKSATKSRRRPPRIYLNKFRVPIYVQLCLVICILCGLCVMVVAVTTVFSSFLLRLVLIDILV